jgi:hypothetical protein
MKIHRALQAKIVRHAEGLGVPTPEIVRQRALEIAAIEGRAAFTEQDWQQARIELHGGSNGLSPDDLEEMAQFVSERDMVAGSTGHHTENLVPEDVDVGEELVSEGMDEAVHDRMLEASKIRDDSETA